MESELLRDGDEAQATRCGALPGEKDVDHGLLEACAERVGRIYARKCLEATLEACEEVVNTFFEGDLEAFRTRAKRHVTFRHLCEHPRVRRSVGAMSRLLGVYVQVNAMDATVAHRLSVAHHQVLLPVASVEEKNRLGRRAIEEHLGKREFATIARQAIDAQATGRRGGPTPAPALVKAVRGAAASLRTVPPMTTSPVLPEMDPEAQLALAEEMERLGRQLTAMAGHVRGQVDAIRRRPTARW